MIKDRILQVIDYYGLKKRDFFSQIGMTSANFRGDARKTPLNSTAIENVFSQFPDLSLEWLITGEGEMLKSSATPPTSAADERTDAAFLPLVPLDAMAGALTGERQILASDCEPYSVPVFKGADFLIPIKGDSMQPNYRSGDIVACKRISPEDIFFQWGKVYVLDTSQGAIIKRVKPADTPEELLIVSDNPDYEPFSLPRSSVYSLALVVGLIRPE